MSDTENRMKLIAYRGDRSACWYFRLHAPLIYVARNMPDKYDITIASSISKDQIGKFKVVILQRQYKMDVLAPVLEMKKGGAKLIYEIDDDLFNVPDWNPASKTLNTRSVQDGIRHFLKEVDALFVTTDALASIYREYCENIYVLPNSIDYEVIYPSPINTVKPVICWQGSMTHEKDLAIAHGGFEKMARDPGMLLKLWVGYDAKSKEPLFHMPGAQILPLVPFEAFYQMFGQVGTYIGLAPLCANVFNRSKSNLKFLEYTVYGAVTVASAVGPYKDTIEDGVTGILVHDNRDWYDKVKMLLGDPLMHARILKNAQALVQEHYNIEINYKLWDAAITEVSES